MKIAILGPVITHDLFSVIKKKDLKSLPKGHVQGSQILAQLVMGLLDFGH